MDLKDTSEAPTRKISMTRIYGLGEGKKEIVIGWEFAPPKKSERYAIYLGRGKIFRTSPVEEITRTEEMVFIKTANSLYQIEYVK